MIVSAVKDNRFEHPEQEVLGRYTACSPLVFRIDYDTAFEFFKVNCPKSGPNLGAILREAYR
jgi:hypothetical protein